MSAFNQNRSRIVQIIFIGAFILITLQLINLQVFSTKYKMAADNNAFYRKVIYPDRGIIFDRKKRAILENTISYDLVVIPVESKATDTLALCALLNIDTATYKKRMRDLIFKNGAVKPSVFESLLQNPVPPIQKWNRRYDHQRRRCDCGQGARQASRRSVWFHRAALQFWR